MPEYSRQTPSQTAGPMWGYALTWPGSSVTVDPASADAITITGLLLDGDGEPVAYPDGLIELWTSDQLARARTDPYGRWTATLRRPVSERLADGTPQAPHINITVFARGLMKQAQTRMYFPGETEANAADPVLSLVEPDRRALLIASDDGDRLRFDIHLQGPDEGVFFDF